MTYDLSKRAMFEPMNESLSTLTFMWTDIDTDLRLISNGKRNLHGPTSSEIHGGMVPPQIESTSLSCWPSFPPSLWLTNSSRGTWPRTVAESSASASLPSFFLPQPAGGTVLWLAAAVAGLSVRPRRGPKRLTASSTCSSSNTSLQGSGAGEAALGALEEGAEDAPPVDRPRSSQSGDLAQDEESAAPRWSPDPKAGAPLLGPPASAAPDAAALRASSSSARTSEALR